MTKTRFLALVTALALLLAIPTAAFAQNARPHVFVGTVTLDGATAVDGAAVTAWVDGEQVAATNASGGQYVLQVESTTGYAGKTVSFKVSGANASQTIVWEEGGGDILNLTATSGSGPGGGGGDPGSPGARGPAGPAGATGATGGPGPAGAAGSDGSAGSAGPAGPAGATGSAGSAGSAGTAGAAGDDGGGTLALIALIVAIVALLAAGGSYMMGRRA